MHTPRLSWYFLIGLMALSIMTTYFSEPTGPVDLTFSQFMQEMNQGNITARATGSLQKFSANKYLLFALLGLAGGLAGSLISEPVHWIGNALPLSVASNAFYMIVSTAAFCAVFSSVIAFAASTKNMGKARCQKYFVQVMWNSSREQKPLKRPVARILHEMNPRPWTALTEPCEEPIEVKLQF